jgi:glycosyltransferase involved in cell wall biosynthesis
VSDGVRESYSPCLIGESWRTIHNGIDVREFSRAVTESDAEAVRAEDNIGHADTVFLNVGRYVDEKRQEDLIDAMASITETHQTARLFIIGGRGGGPEGLRERVSELEIETNVFVTGRVEEIHPYYAAADVFALASTHEGLPITILEAMAAEQAIVATDIPGVREVIIDDETGLLVTPQKPAELATAMIRLIDKDLRQRLARAGHERVISEFSIEATTEAYEDLYREVTA